MERLDKNPLLSHDYTLCNSKHSDMQMSSTLFLQNIPLIYEIYTAECFVEAIISYVSWKANSEKLSMRLKSFLTAIDKNRTIFYSLSELQRAFSAYHKNENTYKFHLNPILDIYLERNN